MKTPENQALSARDAVLLWLVLPWVCMAELVLLVAPEARSAVYDLIERRLAWWPS